MKKLSTMLFVVSLALLLACASMAATHQVNAATNHNNAMMLNAVNNNTGTAAINTGPALTNNNNEENAITANAVDIGAAVTNKANTAVPLNAAMPNPVTRNQNGAPRKMATNRAANIGANGNTRAANNNIC